ncbi:hypothetical protein BH23GEM3_BH23GEM3_19540 [soil metagenome]
MSHHAPARRFRCYTWRAFERRDGCHIEAEIECGGAAPCCPGCGAILEARSTTRFARSLPLDANGYDLDCRGCRRFWCVVRHTSRSIRLLRMRRLVAAVRAVRYSRADAERPFAGEQRRIAAVA